MNHACRGEFIRLGRINPPLQMLNLFHAHSLVTNVSSVNCVYYFCLYARRQNLKSMGADSNTATLKIFIITINVLCVKYVTSH